MDFQLNVWWTLLTAPSDKDPHESSPEGTDAESHVQESCTKKPVVFLLQCSKGILDYICCIRRRIF